MDEARVLRGLKAAGIAFALALTAALMLVLIPGAPLYGQGEHFPRWVEAMPWSTVRPGLS